MTLQDRMMLYAVTLGRRRTAKQKFLFAKQLSETLPSLGYPVEVQERRNSFERIQNLLAGDVPHADLVFAAPFDTPAHTLISCPYYPFHPELTVKCERRALLVQRLAAALALMIAAAAGVIAWQLSGAAAVLIWLMTAAAAVVCAVLFLGWPNRFNFNRCSASVAVMTMLAENCSHQSNLAFAFCDKAVDTYEGYRLLAQKIDLQQTVVLLDSLAAGERLVIACNSAAAADANRLAVLLKEDKPILRCYRDNEVEHNILSLFPKALCITSGSVESGELIVHGAHTKQDIALDLERLERVERALEVFTVRKSEGT